MVGSPAGLAFLLSELQAERRPALQPPKTAPAPQRCSRSAFLKFDKNSSKFVGPAGISDISDQTENQSHFWDPAGGATPASCVQHSHGVPRRFDIKRRRNRRYLRRSRNDGSSPPSLAVDNHGGRRRRQGLSGCLPCNASARRRRTCAELHQSTCDVATAPADAHRPAAGAMTVTAPGRITSRAPKARRALCVCFQATVSSLSAPRSPDLRHHSASHVICPQSMTCRWCLSPCSVRFTLLVFFSLAASWSAAGQAGPSSLARRPVGTRIINARRSKARTNMRSGHCHRSPQLAQLEGGSVARRCGNWLLALVRAA